jgi:hypothetical protein
MGSIFELTPRQWAQVRAALKFWLSVAESSRTHPSRHPAVSDEFSEHGPLNLDEIREILDETPNYLYVNVQDIVKLTGRSLRTVYYNIEREGIQPALSHGRARLFRVDQVIDLVEKLNARASGK